jgi:lysophospholipase L1-like esterase
VTVTIGGNDFGFGDLLRACATGSGCAGRVAAVNGYLDDKLPGVLDKTFAALHKALPNARIVVVGYPNLINPKVSEARKRCGWLTQDNAVTALVALAGKLELTIFAAARAHGLLYDSTLDAMQGHELCTANPYLNAVSAANGPAGGHPNAQGQVALARDVAVYLTL